MRKVPVIEVGTTADGIYPGPNGYFSVPGDDPTISLQFVVDQKSGGGTVTYQWEASYDAVNWYVLAYGPWLTPSVEASTPRTVAAVGAELLFPATPLAQKYTMYRIVVSAAAPTISFHADAFINER